MHRVNLTVFGVCLVLAAACSSRPNAADNPGETVPSGTEGRPGQASTQNAEQPRSASRSQVEKRSVSILRPSKPLVPARGSTGGTSKAKQSPPTSGPMSAPPRRAPRPRMSLPPPNASYAP